MWPKRSTDLADAVEAIANSGREELSQALCAKGDISDVGRINLDCVAEKLRRAARSAIEKRDSWR